MAGAVPVGGAAPGGEDDTRDAGKEGLEQAAAGRLSAAGAGGSSDSKSTVGATRGVAHADAQVVGPSQDAGDGAPGKPDECPDERS